MERLIRKSFVVEISIPKRILFFSIKKNITLKFQQATLWDIITYEHEINKNTAKIALWLYDFLSKYSDKKINNTDFSRIIMNSEKIIAILKKTYFLRDTTKKMPPSGEKSTYASPYSAYFVSIAKELNMDPITMAKTYTQDQIDFFVEGLCWNANEVTDEGKERNRLWVEGQKNQEFVTENKEKIQSILSKLSK